MGINKLLTKIADAAVFTYDKFNQLDILDIAKIHEDSVDLDTSGKHKLFGCKLEGNNNRRVTLPSIEAIASELKHKPHSSQVFIHFIKKGNHQSVVVHGYSQVAVRQIAKAFQVELMSGEEVAISILNTFLVGEHSVSDENRLKYTHSKDYFPKDTINEIKEFVPWELEMVSGFFREEVKNAIQYTKRKHNHFQAVKWENRLIFTPEKLFLLKWEGVVSLRMDFSQSAIKRKMEVYKTASGRGDPAFFQKLKAIEEREKGTEERVWHKSCLVNCVATIKRNANNEEKEIATELSLIFEEDFNRGEEIFSNSILLQRNIQFDAIVPINLVGQFFSSTHKKVLPEKLPPFYYGKDITGNHIEYSPLESTAPHVIFTGRTGSGKSRQAIRGLHQTIGFNKDTGEALRFDDYNVRYADVGYTFGRTAYLLKNKYNSKVKIYPSKTTSLRFSLFDISISEEGVINEDELAFSLAIIIFALNIQDVSGKSNITGNEKYLLKNIIKTMIEEGEYKKDLYVSELKKEGVYDALVEKIYSKGYTDATLISELKEEEFAFLKKPVLGDILIKVGTEKDVARHGEGDQKTLASLGAKLAMLRGYPFLLGHSNTEDEKESFTYIDLDDIKDDPVEFNVIYWLLVRKWTQEMKYAAKENLRGGLKGKPTLFFVDEAHNFFKYEAFVEVFRSAAKEFRKFFGYITFLTQEALEIPEEIITQIGTKIFMTPPEDRAMLKSIVKNTNKELKAEDAIVIDKIEDYMMYVQSDSGGFGMKFDVEDWEEAFFKPLPPSESGIGYE